MQEFCGKEFCEVNNNDHKSRVSKRWEYLSKVGKKSPGVIGDRCPVDYPPDWFDFERFRDAQKLAKAYFFR